MPEDTVRGVPGEGDRAWLQVILDATPVVIYAKDLAGRLTMVNAAFEDLVHADRAELVGRTGEDVFGAEAGAGLWESDRQVLESGEPLTTVEEVPRGGELRRFSAVKMPLRAADGTTYGVAGIWTDITEQSRSHEAAARLALALDATGDGMATFDRDLIVTSWNAAAEKLSGFSAEQIVGQDVSALAPLALLPADAARLAATYAAVLAGLVLEREASHRTASGQEIVLRTLIYPTRSVSGEVTGGLVLGRDVTAERAAEEERLRLQHQVEHLQRLESLGQLAGGVAHDFNNLLAVINLTAEVLESSLPAGSPQRAQTQQILAAAARGVALTRKMLVFAHREPALRTVVDLNDVVRRAELLLDPTLGERIGRTTDLATVPALVSGDPLQLEQVVINLAANARDAMPDGRGHLVVQTRLRTLTDDVAAVTGTGTAPGRYVVLSVSDDGAGMDEQTLAHALEPFFTTKAPGQGTGLGLAMVYGVVTSSGGTVQVRSTVGAGTTVEVYLPLAEGAPASAPEQLPRPEGGRGELVVVVEDADDLRALVESLLTRAGYRVVSHADPARVLLDGATVPPDLLVTDVVMPGIDGPTLAAELRRRHPGMRVLLMSGYRPEDVRNEPGDRLLPKPFVADDLLHAVREVLDAPPGG
jgi:PAS domain S-box-containing protein